MVTGTRCLYHSWPYDRRASFAAWAVTSVKIVQSASHAWLWCYVVGHAQSQNCTVSSIELELESHENIRNVGTHTPSQASTMSFFRKNRAWAWNSLERWAGIYVTLWRREQKQHELHNAHSLYVYKCTCMRINGPVSSVFTWESTG